MSDPNERNISNDAMDDLHALLDGELDPAREVEVRDRIDGDPELRAEFDSLRRTVESVRGLSPIPAPADLMARISGKTTAARPAGGLAPILRWFVPVAAVAAAVLVAVVVTNRSDGPVSTQLPDEARVEDLEERDKDDLVGENELTPRSRPEGGVVAGKKTGRSRDSLTRGMEKGLADADRADLKEEKRAEAEGRKPAGGKAAGSAGPAKAARKSRKDVPKGFAAPADSAEVLRAAVKGAPVAKRFDDYLGALGGLERARLRKHIESFGVLGASSGRRAKPGGPQPGAGVAAGDADPSTPSATKVPNRADCRLANQPEAQRVAALLQRAYPVTDRKKKIADSDAPRGASTMTSKDRRDGAMVLWIEATPRQFKKIRSWLQRVSQEQRGEHADNTPRGYSSLAGSSKRQSYRVTLGFLKNPSRK